MAVLAALLPGPCGAGPALAEPVHVAAQADAGAPQAQARQQALERGFVEAAFQEALRLLPGPLPESRAAALRQYLAPKAMDLVLSYQETPAAKLPPAPAPAAGQDQPAGVALELDVEVNHPYLHQILLRLGFFAGARHPRSFSLRLGPGLTEKDVQPLGGLLPLLGLSRSAQAQAEVTLERLPQGYLKGVLRHGATMVAADGGDISALWLDLWGRFFAGSDLQSASSARSLLVSGFASVDAVQEFGRVLAGWDDAVQDAALSVVNLTAQGISARFTCRVVNQNRLDAHLKDYLPGRLLKAEASGTGQ